MPATELSAAFYWDAVAPLLAGEPHAAGLLGWGSDVLGYDTERSTDHGWGPRLLVFLSEGEHAPDVRRLLDAQLPESFAGWPVRFGWDDVTPRHHVTVTTLHRWLTDFLGIDATGGMSTLDWLLTPQQRLLGVVSGAGHTDGCGSLAAVRSALSWYPEQVWRWLLACQWHRLAQDEAFVARTAEVGDATGSAVVAARLVREMMRLALLLDRRYAPYDKWLGTAFAGGAHADGLPEHLNRVLSADAAPDREAALADAWVALGNRHNAAGLTTPVPVRIGTYHRRPAQVLMADRFTGALLSTVTDPFLQGLPPIGSVDHVTDHAEVLSTPAHYRRLATLWRSADPLT
ncbi:DUF4037 domain-containing protein [Blastococcus xanthinilyticus]|uniref:DUF4037 domain-containing protein n=1 Tax=Blastococcus xanthinilyticus TaxID=1564164 RepID=UPI001AA0CE63|nr:DUF4037 domain-containing protein [Blastococcus xanthinilyticus]